LDCSSLPNLEKLTIEHQLITHLNLANCQKLEELHASGNGLEEVIFPNQAPNLTNIYLTNNNLRLRDLSCFSPFTNLEKLFIGSNNENRQANLIDPNFYNR
jgi:Leucine-rich repeat (LRR) protein